MKLMMVCHSCSLLHRKIISMLKLNSYSFIFNSNKINLLRSLKINNQGSSKCKWNPWLVINGEDLIPLTSLIVSAIMLRNSLRVYQKHLKHRPSSPFENRIASFIWMAIKIISIVFWFVKHESAGITRPMRWCANWEFEKYCIYLMYLYS